MEKLKYFLFNEKFDDEKASFAFVLKLSSVIANSYCFIGNLIYPLKNVYDEPDEPLA